MGKKTIREIIIGPKSSYHLIDLHELWQYRELLLVLAWRDIKIRYKQTLLGIAWVVFQPLINMVIFSFFFGKVAKIPSGNLPYPLFVLSGLIFWIFFSNAISNASNSLIINEDMIKKVYFPKMIAPLATILTALLDFAINLVLLAGSLLLFGRIPSMATFVILPICIIVTVITTSGIGLFLSAVNVKYRDVRYILPFFIQLLLFVTPIIYPANMLKKEHLYIIALNPMTGIVTAFRTVIERSGTIDYSLLIIGCISSLMIFFIGLVYFHKTERFFADIV